MYRTRCGLLLNSCYFTICGSVYTFPFKLYGFVSDIIEVSSFITWIMQFLSGYFTDKPMRFNINVLGWYNHVLRESFDPAELLSNGESALA